MTTNQKSSRFAVNRRLLPVKSSYFFVLGAVAALFPYVSVYMKQLGLTPAEVAIIYGTMPFIDALIRPVIGAVADKLQAHKAVLMISCICTGLSMAGLIFTPHSTLRKDDLGIEVKVTCSHDNSHVEYCTEVRNSSGGCSMSPGYFLNRTSSTLDPFTNSSDCVMRCSYAWASVEDLGICFTTAGVTPGQDCGRDMWKQHDLLSHVEFTLEDMNHSMTRYQYTSQVPEHCPSVCYTYSMAAFTHNDTAYQVLYCTQPLTLQCSVQCSHYGDNSTHVYSDHSGRGAKFGQTFWVFFMVFLLGNIFFSPIFSMIDAMTYAYLGDERHKWGQQRLWGTVGFAVFGFITGLAMHLYRTGSSEINYIFCFIAYAVLNIFGAASVFLYDISTRVSASQVLDNLCTLLRHIEIVAVFVFVFVSGMIVGVRETFLFWHLQTLGGSQVLLGLCMLMNCILEIPMLRFAGTIIKKLGMTTCLCAVCLAFIVRNLGYSFLTSPWWFLCLEPLQAITFGLMYATSSAYASSVTPPGMHGTVQGIIAGLHFGFGKGCGSLLGGAVFEVYGASATFQSCSGLALALLVFYVGVQLYVRYRKPKPDESTAEQKETLQQKDGHVLANPSAAPGTPRENGHSPQPKCQDGVSEWDEEAVPLASQVTETHAESDVPTVKSAPGQDTEDECNV